MALVSSRRPVSVALGALACGVWLSAAPAQAGPPRYTLKDDRIHVPACVRPILGKIATAFHRRTRKTLVVTDGTRTVDEQASLVLTNLREGKDIVRLYAAKELAQEVTDAFRAIPRERQEKDGKKVVTRVLKRQLGRGEYLSKHMRKGALDLRIHDLSSSERKTLRLEIRRQGVQLVDESRGKRPHYHLNFMACLPVDPKG